ncbi:hypothetical protein LR48_Vigan04g053600 [Vigna angularis]|uniref:Uncharacterized protein n=1 Tax=Phaseolus angularis TaxID=3914 RepID=A0A0L9UC44_PHAAN|nr:hypothetical protein LR48_Vigan04g053600 [Vigna angularis]
MPNACYCLGSKLNRGIKLCSIPVPPAQMGLLCLLAVLMYIYYFGFTLLTEVVTFACLGCWKTDAFPRNSVWCLRLGLVVDGGRKREIEKPFPSTFASITFAPIAGDRRLPSSSRPLLVVTTAKCFGRFLCNVWSAPLLPSPSPVLLSSGFAAASASICRGYLHFLSRQACCHAPRYLRVLKVSPSSFEPLDLGADRRRVEGLNHWTPVRIEKRGLNHWTLVRIGGE